MKNRRVFLAIPLNARILNQIVPLLGELKKTGADLTLVDPKNLHLTLHFFGQRTAKEITEIQFKFLNIIKKYNPFILPIKSVGAFPSLDKMRVIWVGAHGPHLAKLVGQIENAFGKEDREAIPHITLARFKSAKKKGAVRRVVKESQDVNLGNQIVDTIYLYEGLLSSDGPVYRKVKTFKLLRYDGGKEELKLAPVFKK